MTIAHAIRALPALACCIVICAVAARADSLTERPDLEGVFTDQRATGTFALLDVAADRMTVIDRERAERRYFPASTFKIANSLIALETGVVKDEREVIPYGGQPQPIKEWERDMGMRDAISISNVPVYQEIARRIGLGRMKAELEQLDYGNAEIGRAITRFWLDGPLQISAVEQVRFLARLAHQELPLSARSQSIVRDILRLEERNGAVLYGKTGWTTSVEPGIGWWVGWVERRGKVHAFALNIDMAAIQDAPKRVAIGRALLGRLGVF